MTITTTVTTSLTEEQIAQLEVLLRNEQYPEAYRKIRDFAQQNPESPNNLLKWLESAASINAGFFHS
ncbi:hypothetical protein [Glaciecola sp. SC05]|uniref:hypothetical protein n=1 Tax=Glaciecola sp. SC05 TaxID=1987355 RepID=UPI003526D015